MIVLSVLVILWIFALGMVAGITVAAFTKPTRRLPEKWWE